MSKPLVSILIPTSNRLILLKEAVRSVLAQTSTDYEVIITDNCSTDGTQEWVKNIAKKNKIPYQLEIVDSGEGDTNLTAIDTDARMFQINIPVRYQHTSRCEADIRDVENASKMIQALIEELA